MTRTRWHILRDGDSLTLARHLPLRWDLAAHTMVPTAPRARLAQNIRQDLWRALQNLRGFSPAIQITRMGDQMQVTAGGRVDGAVPPGAQDQIADLLHDPKLRARWLRHVGGRK